MSAPPRRRPGRPSGGQPVADRDALLDAAERVIARDGSGVSLDAVALEAGVTKPVVYARIGSRAELSNALAERLAGRLLAAASAAETFGDGSPFGEKWLATLFTTILETLAAHRELFMYVTRGTADDAPGRTLYLAAESARPLAEGLAAWREGVGQDPAVAVPWAYGIVGMLNLVSLWWMEESTLPASAVAGQLAQLVWSGLRPEARDLTVTD